MSMSRRGKISPLIKGGSGSFRSFVLLPPLWLSPQQLCYHSADYRKYYHNFATGERMRQSPTLVPNTDEPGVSGNSVKEAKARLGDVSLSWESKGTPTIPPQLGNKAL